MSAVHEAVGADGEFVLDNDAIQAERSSMGGVIGTGSDTGANFIAVAEACLSDGVVDQAGGRSQSEKEGIGYAIDVDASVLYTSKGMSVT